MNKKNLIALALSACIGLGIGYNVGNRPVNSLESRIRYLAQNQNDLNRRINRQYYDKYSLVSLNPYLYQYLGISGESNFTLDENSANLNDVHNLLDVRYNLRDLFIVNIADNYSDGVNSYLTVSKTSSFEPNHPEWEFDHCDNLFERNSTTYEGTETIYYSVLDQSEIMSVRTVKALAPEAYGVHTWVNAALYPAGCYGHSRFVYKDGVLLDEFSYLLYEKNVSVASVMDVLGLSEEEADKNYSIREIMQMLYNKTFEAADSNKLSLS